MPAAAIAIVLALMGSLVVWQAAETYNLESPLPAMCTLPGVSPLEMIMTEVRW